MAEKENRKRFTVPAILEGVNALKDKGLSLRFHTSELTAEEKVMIMDSCHNVGWLLWDEEPMTEADIPEESVDIEGFKKKTPSQKLRARMFVYHKEKYGLEGFDQWYENEFEKIGDVYLKKLNQIDK